MNNPYIRELQEQREQMVCHLESLSPWEYEERHEEIQENINALDAETDFFIDVEQLALDVKQTPPEPCKPLCEMSMEEQRVWFESLPEIDPDA